MSVEAEVLAAAQARADALGSGDEHALRSLLHARFGWTSHKGEVFHRDRYLRANVGGPTRWRGQRLEDPVVVVVDEVAVLRCVVVDEVELGQGREQHQMAMTQTWVGVGRQWQCLAGHAGPRWA